MPPQTPIEPWEVLDLLTSLVEKSLVLYEEQDGKGRYRLLETIRQYGQEKLEAGGGEGGPGTGPALRSPAQEVGRVPPAGRAGTREAGGGPGTGQEAVAARDRHRDWYLALAEQRKLDPRADRENLAAALQWSMQRSDAEAALRLGVALMFFWWTQSLREGRERLAAALALPGAAAPTAARAHALSMAGALAWRQGDYQGALELLKEGLAIGRQLGDQESSYWSLLSLGVIASYQGDYQRGRELTEESLAIGRQLGDQHHISGPLCNLGIFAVAEGDYERARALLEESLAIARQIGHQEAIADSLDSLGRLARHQGDFEGARALLEESLATWRRLEDRGGSAYSLEGLAAVARSQGDYERARALYEESLRIFRPTGEYRGIAAVLEGLAGLAAADDQAERAARLFGAAEALRTAIATPLAPGERADYDRDVAATQAALGEAAFAAAWAAGRALSLEAAIQFALGDYNA